MHEPFHWKDRTGIFHLRQLGPGMIQDEIRLIRPDLEAWEITGFWLHIPFMWIKRMQSGQ